MKKAHGRLSIHALKIAKRNVFSWTFSMSLKIEKQNGVAHMRKETRAIQATGNTITENKVVAASAVSLLCCGLSIKSARFLSQDVD